MRIDTKTAKSDGSAPASPIARSTTAPTANDHLARAALLHVPEAEALHHALEVPHHALEALHHALEALCRGQEALCREQEALYHDLEALCRVLGVLVPAESEAAHRLQEATVMSQAVSPLAVDRAA